MTARERLLTVLRRGQPDRVPVTIYEMSVFNDDWANREPSYAPLLELERQWGDTLVYTPTNCPVLLGDPGRARVTRETEPDGTVVTTTMVDTPQGPLRCVSRRAPDVMTGWQVEPFIKSDADIARVLALPEPEMDVRPDWLRARAMRLGESGLLCINCGDALGHVVGLFDFEDFVRRCRRDDGPIRALLERAQARLLRAIGLVGQVVRDVPYRLWGPEYCGAPLMNPRIYFRRYVVEQVRELTAAIHATGGFSVIHCHGRLRDLLDMMLETGADGLEPIEALPMETADVTLADVKQRVGHRMCLLGAIQALALETYDDEQMERHVRDALEAGAPGGGFALLPTSAPFMLPLSDRYRRNAEIMYRTAHAYGRYGDTASDE